ncbi:hypothetical protein LJT99_12805 [Lentisphaerae bacterium WC36]|nr:hypothetical protein LJT99_12805 [Lentisphaerae bacterium WC36]
MNKKQIIELIGQPARDEESCLIYEKMDGRYLTTTKIHFDDKGIFNGFKDGWSETVLTAPKKGSLDWMKEKIYNKVGSSPRNYNLGPLTKEDALLIFDIFIEKTPKASDEEWNELCEVISTLAMKSYIDKRIAPSLEKRYIAQIANEEANFLIAVYFPKKKYELFKEQLQIIYKEINDLKNEGDRPSLNINNRIKIYQLPKKL